MGSAFVNKMRYIPWLTLVFCLITSSHSTCLTMDRKYHRISENLWRSGGRRISLKKSTPWIRVKTVVSLNFDITVNAWLVEGSSSLPNGKFNCAYHVECAKGKKGWRFYDESGLLQVATLAKFPRYDRRGWKILSPPGSVMYCTPVNKASNLVALGGKV